MPRLPIVGLQAGTSGRFDAPHTEPRRNFTGQQFEQAGQALGRAGAVATDIGHEQRERFDDARANETLNRFIEFDLAEQNRHNALVGKAAVDDEEPTRQRYADFRRKVVEGLDEFQRELVEPHLQRSMARSLASVQGHALEQGNVWRAGEAEAGWKLRAEKYSTLVDRDPAEAARTRAEALQMVNEWADLTGQGPERAAAARLAATTTMHEQVIRNRATSGRGSEAAAYLEANRREISGARLDDLQRLVRTATVGEESTRLSMDVVGEAVKVVQGDRAKLDQDRPLNAEEIQLAQRIALESIDQKFAAGTSAEVRDQARSRVKERFGEIDRGIAQQGNSVMTNAEKWLLANPLASPDMLPPDIASEVDRLGLRGDVNAFANSSKRYVSDPVAAAGVLSIPDDVLRQVPAEVLVRQFRAKLDDQDLRLLLARQQKALGTTNKNDEVAISRATLIKEAFLNLKGLPLTTEFDKNNEAAAKEFGIYRRNIQKLIDQEPSDKDLAPKRLQEILDAAALDTVRVDRSFVVGDKDVASALVDDKTRPDAYVDIGTERVLLSAISQEQRTRIASKLRARNLPVTEREIARLWVYDGKPK
jgi:hypothetical protein